MASTQSASTLPQGFSVYQHTLGAPLQFLPALGSQQLDDFINAFIPGPAPASEKRATISLDFLEYAQMTGQNFKFYPVNSAPSVATSPSIDSPSLDSVNSSFNVSPTTPSWDWSATSAPSVASSSRGSTQSRRKSKAKSSPSRHQTTDFSHLPGMKILTKDGQDVTNTASRGSKTKEQRDHAHLMRIIKACDSCRRKKIRCDPSHKKRGAAQAAPPPASKSANKARAVPQDPPCLPSAAVPDRELLFASSSFDLDSGFDFSGLENLDPATLTYDPFDEFIQFPPMDTPDLDFPLESEAYLSSQPTTTTSSSSAASPLRSFALLSQPELGAPPGVEFVNPELQEISPNLPFLGRSGSSSDYIDFNLYSPESSFSEDERMLPIGASTSSLPSLNEPSFSECPPPLYETVPDGEANEWDGPGLSVDELQFHSANEGVGGRGHSSLSSNSSGQFATMSHVTAGESVNEYGSRPNRVPSSEPLSQVVICVPPGTVVVAGDTSPGQNLDNVPTTSLDSSVASSSIDVGVSVVQTAAFMSNLALYVMAAALTAIQGGVWPRKHSPTATCRTMSGRSSCMLDTMSPLCVA
ncbi:transcription factor Cys6 [Metarhizium brunneum]